MVELRPIYAGQVQVPGEPGVGRSWPQARCPDPHLQIAGQWPGSDDETAAAIWGTENVDELAASRVGPRQPMTWRGAQSIIYHLQLKRPWVKESASCVLYRGLSWRPFEQLHSFHTRAGVCSGAIPKEMKMKTNNVGCGYSSATFDVVRWVGVRWVYKCGKGRDSLVQVSWVVHHLRMPGGAVQCQVGRLPSCQARTLQIAIHHHGCLQTSRNK
ncbi:hypothetical protein GGR57DRAFT_308552 [Xylariaceae sp. FL1272]|nr:hypothetical protein GGR57DRAFT_308552 [Xylariaceae sp. FL1272]